MIAGKYIGKDRIESFTLALAIALISQSNSRFAGPIGAGELLLLLLAVIKILQFGGTPQVLRSNLAQSYMLIWVTFLFVVTLPTTIVMTLSGIQGASIEEFAAYTFSALAFLIIAVSFRSYREAARYFVVLILVIFTAQYFLGGSNAWYSVRFTGGAKNPNQTALYTLCAICAIFVSDMRLITKYIAFAGLTGFAYLSKSDAALLALMIGVAFAVASTMSPRNVILSISVQVSVLLVLAMFLLNFTNLLEGALYALEKSDEGDSRATLFSNGLAAWLDTPYSFLLGNGAGVFSGMQAPFNFAESHNTVIDGLSIFGLFGTLLVLWPISRSFATAYKTGNRALAASILIVLVFMMFHFVLRQPVFWFTLVILLSYVREHTSTTIGFSHRRCRTCSLPPETQVDLISTA